MREFHVEDWFYIKGRGDVAAVKNDEEFDRDTGHHMIGEKVVLDGVVYTVKGVESRAVNPIRKGAPIGLLVAEPRHTTEEVHKLKAQLWKYGKHLTACRLHKDQTSWCDCGWKEVRETLAPTHDVEAKA